MTSVVDLRARNAGFRLRTRPELIRDVAVACSSLGDLSHAGIGEANLAGIERTVEGVRRLLADLRQLAPTSTGGDGDAA